MRGMIATENQEQRALVKWLSLHPELKDCFMKIHNEGRRTPGQTWNLKLLGLKPGASDLFIYYPSGIYHGLFIEMKRNRVYSPSEMATETWIGQVEFQECVKKLGYEAFICYGWLDAKNRIEKYLISA